MTQTQNADEFAILMSVSDDEFAAVGAPSSEDRARSMVEARADHEAAERDMPRPVVTENIRVR